jgi:ubiquinol-cytochrome c reductase cytochrome b subunit
MAANPTNPVVNWIEQRTGLVSMTTEFLTEDVPGGASYWYVFGSATLFAMILQFVTGIFLTFYYAPSALTAWESTKYIYTNVPLGWFVISLHSWGATAMIALMLLHFLQVTIWGAYKAPREMGWVIGVVLIIITLVLGLTGYLLPWDLDAYLASSVAINIAASVPLMGSAVQQFLMDGNALGTLTINRFFGLHVWLSPALLALLVVGHLLVFRHNGGAGPPTDADLKKLPQGRFWPDQMFMDAVASFVVFAIIVALSIFSPTPLDERADPTNTTFVAYPAWYFLALYGLLRFAGLAPHGPIGEFANLLATVLVPGLIVAFLILLPFIDRNPSRRISRRPWAMTITAVGVVGAIGFSLYSQLAILQEVKDKQAPAAAAAAPAAAAPAAGGAAASAGGGTQAAGGADKGAAIYAQSCAGCHGAAGQGTPGVFPPLAKSEYVADDKKLIHALLYGLQGAVTVEGKTYNGMMPAWKGQLTDPDIAAVATYVRKSWGNTGGPITEADLAKVPK